MGRRLTIAFAMMVIAAVAGDAKPVSPATVQSSTARAATKAFAGVVQAVTLADPEHEIRSEIVAVEKNGRRSSFLVTPSTTIYDPAWKVLALGQIQSGEWVKIRYITTADGLNVSRSIHLIGKQETVFPSKGTIGVKANEKQA
jgi:hypothetical protein